MCSGTGTGKVSVKGRDGVTVKMPIKDAVAMTKAELEAARRRELEAGKERARETDYSNPNSWTYEDIVTNEKVIPIRRAYMQEKENKAIDTVEATSIHKGAINRFGEKDTEYLGYKHAIEDARKLAKERPAAFDHTLTDYLYESDRPAHKVKFASKKAEKDYYETYNATIKDIDKQCGWKTNKHGITI